MLADPKTGLPQLPSPEFLEQVAAVAKAVGEDEFLTEDLEGKRCTLEDGQTIADDEMLRDHGFIA